jgi:hypothetical protein
MLSAALLRLLTGISCIGNPNYVLDEPDVRQLIKASRCVLLPSLCSHAELRISLFISPASAPSATPSVPFRRNTQPLPELVQPLVRFPPPPDHIRAQLDAIIGILAGSSLLSWRTSRCQVVVAIAMTSFAVIILSNPICKYLF